VNAVGADDADEQGAEQAYHPACILECIWHGQNTSSETALEKVQHGLGVAATRKWTMTINFCAQSSKVSLCLFTSYQKEVTAFFILYENFTNNGVVSNNKII